MVHSGGARFYCLCIAMVLFGFGLAACGEANDSPTPVEYSPETMILPTPMVFATNTPNATATVVPTGTAVAGTTPPGGAKRIATPTPVNWKLHVSGISLVQQQQTLTCEEAAAAMASRGRFSEAQLVAAMPRNENPFLGIRGRTNAPVFGTITDYGVYATGLDKGLSKLGFKAEILHKQSYDDFLNTIQSYLRADKPVVWWTTWHQTAQKPINVKLSDGTLVKMVPFEHAVVLVGTTDLGFMTHDPYDGSIRFVSWADHKRASGYFDNMALVLK
jgi:uncharacterized protein YvpB